MTEETTEDPKPQDADTVSADVGVTEHQASGTDGSASPVITEPAPGVLISGTSSTLPVSISADEHQLIADLKAAGHDLTVLFKDLVATL